MKTALITCGVIFVVFVILGIILVASTVMVVVTDKPVPPVATTAWWSDRAAGLIGGIGGTIIGLLGGLIGVLTSMGKARGFVIGLARGLIVFGAASFIFGLVAVAKGQPYAVYYPALLVGFILTLMMGLNIRTIEARYREIELRKMRIQDATDEGRGAS